MTTTPEVLSFQKLVLKNDLILPKFHENESLKKKILEEKIKLS